MCPDCCHLIGRYSSTNLSTLTGHEYTTERACGAVDPVKPPTGQRSPSVNDQVLVLLMHIAVNAAVAFSLKVQ